jgi:hypothetical protein
VWQKINNYTEKNHLQWNRFTLIGILLITVLGIRITNGLEQYMDVLFWDEALYLSRGVLLFEHIPKTWGPVYSLWYKFWSFFVHDRVDLYYFNFKLTTILISVVFFLLLLASGVQRILAFILAVFFLSSFINLPLWPRVSHFCVIIMVAAVIKAKYFHSIVSKLAIYAYAAFICAYARPELFLPFMIFYAALVVLFLGNIKNHKKTEWMLMAVLTCLVVVVVLYLKTPFNSGDAGRGLRVFLQHFAWNYAEWNQLDIVFWLDFDDIIQQHFKDSSTLSAVLQSNPAAIQHHVLSNIQNYVMVMGKIIFSFFAPIFTKDTHWLCLMVSIMLFAIYFSFTKTTKDKRKIFYALAKDNLLTILVLALFALPSVVASLYAYPRQHYLILQVPILLLLAGLIISSITVEMERSLHKLFVIGVVWFFVTPVAEDFTYFNLFRKEDSLCNKETVQYIKKYYTTNDSIRVFDAEGYLTNLLPSNFTNYNEQYYRNTELVLSDFIQQHSFDIIYKTPTLLKLKNVQKDSVLTDLLKNPEQYGYFEQKTGNFTPSLLLKIKK